VARGRKDATVRFGAHSGARSPLFREVEAFRSLGPFKVPRGLRGFAFFRAFSRLSSSRSTPSCSWRPRVGFAAGPSGPGTSAGRLERPEDDDFSPFFFLLTAIVCLLRSCSSLFVGPIEDRLLDT
jgi:hypothetical protein